MPEVQTQGEAQPIGSSQPIQPGQPAQSVQPFKPTQPAKPLQPVKRVLNKTKIVQLIWCAGLALWWVVFNWGLFERNISALGFNAFVFYLLWVILFIWILKSRNKFQKRDLGWIIPLILVALSFWLFENPFVKIISFWLYPILLTVAATYAFADEKAKQWWNLYWVGHLITRFFTAIAKIGRAVMYYIDLLSGKKEGKPTGLAKKIILGIIILLAVLLIVVLPVLSSADPAFAAVLGNFWQWLNEILAQDFIWRIILFIALAVLLFAAVLSWARRTPPREAGPPKKIDDVISGIVIGGILVVYLIFIVIQLERLWVGNLPFDFAETETLVKSGFWQLLFLSFVNILIYFIYYQRTKPLLQAVLAVFSGASVLLLASAAYRMGLYVTYYGFSYEKFYASYTVLFCLIIFGWLIIRLFAKTRADIIKFLCFLFLWMFALVAILPVERIVLETNIALKQRADSRINLYELTMFSADVLPAIEHYQPTGILNEDLCDGEYSAEQCQWRRENLDWNNWRQEQEEIIKNKAWYEKNWSNY